jgi:hypothetical protein
MITKTIGAGGDYADIHAAWDAIIAGGALSDDWTFNIISSFTESAGVSDWGPAFNNHTVIFQDLTHSYTIQSAFDFNFALSGNMGASLIFDGLHIISTSNTGGRFLSSNTITTDGCVSIFRNLKLHGPSAAGTKTAIGLNNSVWRAENNFLNCIIDNFGSGIDLANNDVTYTGTDHICENCSIFNCKTGINLPGTTAAKNVTIRNTVAFGCSISDFAAGGADNIVTNCADGDGSIATSGAIITGTVTLVTAADFVSVVPASADFLKVAATSKLYLTGTLDLSAWNTADYAGNPRPIR